MNKINLLKPVLVLLGCILLHTQQLRSQDLNRMIITIELKNATLTEALNRIESLTALKFNYRSGDLAGVNGITYKQQQVPVKKVLNDLLQNTSLQYEQVQNYILIKKKPALPRERGITKTDKDRITVTGVIKEAVTGEPLPYVNIGIRGLPGGSVTNAEGYFTLHGIPADSSVLIFTAIGHEQVQYMVTAASNNKMITIEMKTESRHLHEVTIEHKKNETFKLNQRPGLIQLSPANMAVLPKIGEKDIFRSLQLMPGISAGNEQSAGLYVRGGTPDENLVLFDGFTVYNVDHLFGFFSTFNTNAVKDVQVYKSGFDAKYGGRLSALVDITGKEGNKNQFNAGIDLSAMSVNGFVETPIGKKMTALVAYRRSYKTPLYDSLLNHAKADKGVPSDGTMATNVVTGNSNLQSYFDDLNAKLTFRPTGKDAISLSFYHGKDNLNNNRVASDAGDTTFVSTITDITRWSNTGASLKWAHTWSPKFFTNTLLSYSRYYSDRRAASTLILLDPINGNQTYLSGFTEKNNLQDYSLKTGFEWMPDQVHGVEGGLQITRQAIAYRYVQNDTTTILDRNTTGSTPSAYLQDKLQLLHNKLVVTPGIRVSQFNITRSFYYEPRLTATYDLTANIKLKGSAGQYYQFAKRVVREDILNGSRDFWVLADGTRLPVGSSQQYMMGISHEDNNYLVDIEAWYKNVRGLSEYTLRYQTILSGLPYEELFYQGRGYARGVDVLLQKKFGKYTGWIGYTLAEAKQNFAVYDSGYFYASNDIRHEFKMVHTFHHKRWDFTIAWMFLTGKAYTAPSGGYQLTLPDSTTKSFLVITDKNTLRLPEYHRLDIAINWNYGKPGKLNGLIGVSVFNTYNRKNTWYKNFQIIDDFSGYYIIETNINYLRFTPNLTITCNLK
jgi:ferric enterobactin receptor